MPDEIKQPVKKMGKLVISREIVGESWGLLRKNKEMMYFPVVSSLVTLSVFLLAFVLYMGIFFGLKFSAESWNYLFTLGDIPVYGDVIKYGLLLVGYVVLASITNFFDAGLLVVAQGRLSGKNVTFREGIRYAWGLKGSLFTWSLVVSTVGVVLNIISDKSKWLGKLVSWLLGVSWSIATFFSLPSLVIDRTSLKDSFTQSASLIKKTWGETALGKIEIGAFFFIFIFMFFVLAFIIGANFPFVSVWIVLGVLFGVLVIGVSIVSSTLEIVFKLVMFNYAKTGTVPDGFSRDLIDRVLSKD